MYEDQIIFLLSETIRIIKDVVICIKQILPIYFFLSIRVYIKDRNKTVSDQNIYMKNIIRIIMLLILQNSLFNSGCNISFELVKQIQVL